MQHPLEVLQVHRQFDLGDLFVGILIILVRLLIVDYVRLMFGIGRFFLIPVTEEGSDNRTPGNFLCLCLHVDHLLVIELVMTSPVVQVTEMLFEALKFLALGNQLCHMEE